MTDLARPVNLILCLSIVAVCVPAQAQQASRDVLPRVTVVHPGYTKLQNDLKALFKLTTKSEQKHWKDLNEMLLQFEGGITKAKPVRVDFMVAPGFPMLFSVPVSDIATFRDNLDVLAFSSTRDRRDKSLFSLPDMGFMRFYKGYATIGATKNDVAISVVGEREKAIAEILRRKFSIGGEVVNTKLDAASQAARRQKFQKPRKDLMSAVKKMPSESKAAFLLRKAAAEHQMDEAERLLAETQRMTFGALMKPKASAATLVLDLKPIADTQLAATVAEFGKNPSMFHAVKREASSVMSLRINHPLDAMRKENFDELFTLALPDAIERVNDSTLTASDKAAGAEFLKHLFSLLKEGAASGVIDAFVEVTGAPGGKHTMVTGLKVPPKTELVKLVELFAKSHSQHKLEANVAKYGDVAIHKLAVYSSYKAEFGSFFGDEHIVYLGTSDTGFWSAVGPEAKDKLKAAIEAVQNGGEGEADGSAVDFYVHLRPWIALHDKFENKIPPSRNAKMRALRAKSRDLRRKALEAMTPTDDVLTFKIQRVDDRVESVTDIGQGIMRFVGKMLAKISKEQLGL